MRQTKWTLDRGAGYYATEREKRKLASLVHTGKHAGRSRVRWVGVDFQTFWVHVLKRDFFTTAVNAKLLSLVAVLVGWYFVMLLGWATAYYIIWRWNNDCFVGFHGFRSAFMYATETQQTIGYGERATGECWLPAVLVSIHSLQAVLLDSVILGIVFSRISHPKQRSRTVLISDCAVIARRDGQLKFMFRVADIQKRSVIDPRVRAALFTWGPGRRTAEGERIPVTAQDMDIALDCTLLLPTTAEHNIDESSPLFGHTLQSLEAVGAEIVVTFEASSELGDTFMARQSYLPSEIHWGHTFVNIIRSARQGETQHEVDLSRFHDVEPQPGLGDEMTQPHRLSKKVVMGGGGGNVVPGRLLNENTLVLSEDAVVACRNGRPMLMFRLGDTFPGHVLDVQVTAHLYRWQASSTAEGELLPYEECPLELEPSSLLLRYPVTLVHDLDPARSPVAHWAMQKGLRQDADAEVVLVARGTLYSRQEVITRSRCYSVLGDVKWGHAFLPVVLPGASGSGASSKLGAAVDWSHFHATTPITMPPSLQAPAKQSSSQPQVSPRATASGVVEAGGMAAAAAAAGGPGPSRAPPPHQGSRLGPHPSRPSGPERSGSSGTLGALGGFGGFGGPGGGGLGGGGPGFGGPGGGPGSAAMAIVAPSGPSGSGMGLLGGPHGAMSHQHPPTPHPQAHLYMPSHLSQPPHHPHLHQHAADAAAGAAVSAAAHAASAGAHPPPPQPPAPPQPGSASLATARLGMHRSPSAMLMLPGGGDMARPGPANFAAPGLHRRTDEDGGGVGSEDAAESAGNTSYGSGLGTGPGGLASHSMQRLAGSNNPTTTVEKTAADKSWHQTRSLFAALEGIQQYLAEEEQRGAAGGGEGS
ncbi:hypothetical protein HYH03_014920 [Edaphochlamys debaryana]|uniref:Uncharacterized protein n=1 Tax=Edaphochlamys debaryana TaxID=47281 RepID=A0A835XPB4_9CHLO|nr:hypothetical protein HYH03_014920 [Edaphochlamys debaryana]|eukprot:KAG2486473.1 hypothetical protein HYH03_014920 [Edaphochlamys debaryana]